jgi:hypothetical protein
MPEAERERINTPMDITSIASVPSNKAITRASRFFCSTSSLAARNSTDRFSSQRNQFATPLASAVMLTWPTINGTTVKIISHINMRSVGRRDSGGAAGRRERKPCQITAAQVRAISASLTVLRIPRLRVE